MKRTPTFETLHYALSDHIARVTLNRPERRNALNRTAYAELEAVFRHIQGDAEVRCVIVTGADPAFCSGEDVKEMMAAPDAQSGRERLRAVRPEPTPTAVAILECDRPVIAAVNGVAVGWGMELALFADIRLASETARFGEIFIKRGLIADVGGMGRLPGIVGPQAAAELLFTGDIIDAAEALRIGLVARVVPHADLLPAAEALARRIAVNPPLALRYTKEALRRGRSHDLRDLGTFISGTYGVLFATEDHKEGLSAFLEKRAPIFKGR